MLADVSKVIWTTYRGHVSLKILRCLFCKRIVFSLTHRIIDSFIISRAGRRWIGSIALCKATISEVKQVFDRCEILSCSEHLAFLLIWRQSMFWSEAVVCLSSVVVAPKATRYPKCKCSAHRCVLVFSHVSVAFLILSLRLWKALVFRHRCLFDYWLEAFPPTI